MPKAIPSHIQGLLAYVSRPSEKANEDLALGYFRKIFGSSFTRQQEAKHADGYVPGHFVLELKGASGDWLSGLLQGLAYRNSELSFSQIIVAAKGFLAVWRVDTLPQNVRDDIMAASGAPSLIGREFAKKYSGQRNRLLNLAIWNGGVDLTGALFASNPDLVVAKFESFEETLRQGRKERQKITLSNFPKILKEMVPFFDAKQPIKAVRAFYGMLYGWDETSVLKLSQRANDQATLGGEAITDIRPPMRPRLKEFVEDHVISLGPNENHDDFFARFDEALDSVDQGFRIRHGIFFTDPQLSRFVMWLVKRDIPDLGKNYLVIDPACGSGNLVTNWRSPLELRHKVVSEIEPELLFTVEKRMKGDQWHHGKYTVVPKVSENRGLNFLDRSAEEYLDEIRKYLTEKGQNADKPLAFLCNPPYRSDDDQATESIAYEVHRSILEVTNQDAGSERYCCFLAQMKLICEAAKASGLPGDSRLLLFTKSAWLTKRAIFQNIRAQILGSFEDAGGILIKSNEFFDVSGSWPVAFTLWRYKGKEANLNPHRSIPMVDLTWLTKEQVARIPWDDADEAERACSEILNNRNSKRVELGKDRVGIRTWSGRTRVDFMRSRRKDERNERLVGGLPASDRRNKLKKAHGERSGSFIGFMDDLTPCRVKTSTPDKPWFRLNAQFMDIKKNRCLSGPPTNRGYCATDIASAERLFFWYALARTFLVHPYPMWADAEDMWQPAIPDRFERTAFQMAFVIGYAENDCVEARFPANDPIQGLPELSVHNPMSPLMSDSFWCGVVRPYIGPQMPATARNVIQAVDSLFADWATRLRGRTELPLSAKPYLLDDCGLTRGAGIIQIKDYANDSNDEGLLNRISQIQGALKPLKTEFFELITSGKALDYFGSRKETTPLSLFIPEKTKFDKVLARRLAVAGILVDTLSADPNFGRTKLTKLFYLADTHEQLNLDTTYYREAAGPLDPRTLYHEHVGIESLGRKYKLFAPEPDRGMTRYRPDKQLRAFAASASKYLGRKVENVRMIAELFRNLNTKQCEIVATLYACWNDFLIRGRTPSDDEIIDDFLHRWSRQKAQYSKPRLSKALAWMRSNRLEPKGLGKPTTLKPAT